MPRFIQGETHGTHITFTTGKESSPVVLGLGLRIYSIVAAQWLRLNTQTANFCVQAAEQAIASAERASVADYAAVELSTARDKLSAAHSAVQEQKMILAQRLAQQARADAELASALAEVAKARVVNEQMQKGTDTLKMEMKRKTGDQ